MCAQNMNKLEYLKTSALNCHSGVARGGEWSRQCCAPCKRPDPHAVGVIGGSQGLAVAASMAPTANGRGRLHGALLRLRYLLTRRIRFIPFWAFLKMEQKVLQAPEILCNVPLPLDVRVIRGLKSKASELRMTLKTSGRDHITSKLRLLQHLALRPPVTGHPISSFVVLKAVPGILPFQLSPLAPSAFKLCPEIFANLRSWKEPAGSTATTGGL